MEEQREVLDLRIQEQRLVGTLNSIDIKIQELQSRLRNVEARRRRINRQLVGVRASIEDLERGVVPPQPNPDRRRSQ
jgi:chromosome segregation ATPase